MNLQNVVLRVGALSWYKGEMLFLLLYKDHMCTISSFDWNPAGVSIHARMLHSLVDVQFDMQIH